jgi:hypothetical protein
MARFFPLGRARFIYLGGVLGLVSALALPAQAAPSPTNAAPINPAPPSTAAATNPGAKKVAAAPASPAQEEYVSRYGKILSASNQPPYPFKLSMPFPDVGEIKVPDTEELDVRQKLEKLANLSDAQIRDQLAKWPAFGKMSLADEGLMLMRIQQFRDHRTKVAIEKAHSLGLVTLNPAQKARFEQDYWDKRLQMDRQLSHQLESTIKNADQKLDEELFREFSSIGTLAQGSPPPHPPASGTPPPAATPPKPAPAPAPAMMH